MASGVEPLGDRQVRVIASTADVDRAGEVVVQSGIQLSNFLRNPVILWQHDPSVPIGTANAVRMGAAGVEMTIDFAPPGVSAKADEVCGLVKAGVVCGVSVGFNPLETEPMDPRFPRGPQRYLKCDLMEVSIVSIPANPAAAVIAKRFQTRNHARRVKDFGDVGRLAAMLESLGYLQASTRIEAALEGDGSKLPEQLAQVMQDLGAALVAMTAEEVAEAVAEAQGSLGQEEDFSDLAADDRATVMAGASPAVRRFRAAMVRAAGGAQVRREGRRISACTGDVLRDALAQHDEAMASHREAIKAHTKCANAVKGLLANAEDGSSDTGEGAAGAKNARSGLVVKSPAERQAIAARLREQGGEKYPSHMRGDSPYHYAARHVFDENRRRGS